MQYESSREVFFLATTNTSFHLIILPKGLQGWKLKITSLAT